MSVLKAGVKQFFFDRDEVLRRLTKAERQMMVRFGGTVRKRAKGSIRSRKGASPPGKPPHNHTGLLRNKIFFAYEPSRHAVIIGPERLDELTPDNRDALEMLEIGGTTTRTRGKRRRRVTYKARPFMRPAFEASQRTSAAWLKDFKL